MVNVQPRQSSRQRPRLAQWLYSAIRQGLTAEDQVSLRMQLRGNTLHVLCETSEVTEAEHVLALVKEGMATAPQPLNLVTPMPLEPIYQLILYGRMHGSTKNLWVQSLTLQMAPTTGTGTTEEGFLVTYKSLARSGSPEAIARYLSDCFSHLGVSIQTSIQHYPATETEPPSKRIWVNCVCDYSPDYSLLARPLVQELRELELVGFRDGVIRCQIRGEQKPEWLLWVDLTPIQEMLKDWGSWGDLQAIARLMNQALAPQHLQASSFLKDHTLHVFCSPIDLSKPETLDADKATATIEQILQELAPQGIEAATIYGMLSSNHPNAIPLWVNWVDLPATDNPLLKLSPFSLGQTGHFNAIHFLLERLLNPDLSQRLGTGGIHVKLCPKGQTWHIMTESIVCPPQHQMVEAIENLFKQLDLDEVHRLKIYGRRSGQTNPVWHCRLTLKVLDEETKDRPPTEPLPELQPLETVERTPLPDDEEHDALLVASPSILEEISQTLRSVFCATGIWTAEQNVSSPILARHYTQPSERPLLTDKGVRVAIVWGVLGILLTLQVDWAMGKWLHKRLDQPPSQAQAQELELALITPPEEVQLPNTSLQKSKLSGDKNASNDSFIKDGQQEVILNATVDMSATTAPKAIAPTTKKIDYPSFNNSMLDEKLALYQQRVAENGPPDILIIGSSRALRGLDPLALQQALLQKGYPKLDIFNFGLNGATVKVVDLVLREILTPQQLPQIIIWADGARAFNSGRQDTTYQVIVNSKGYKRLKDGTFPNLFVQPKVEQVTNKKAAHQNPINELLNINLDQDINQELAGLSTLYDQRTELRTAIFEEIFPQLQSMWGLDAESTTKPKMLEVGGETINVDGFLPLSKQFEPDFYYSNHTKVTGYYDSDYFDFTLKGEQHEALIKLVTHLKANKVKLVMINQPVTDQYLDPVRQNYEQQFKDYMSEISTQYGITFQDFTSQESWQQQYKLFSDPSHLNRYGAFQLSWQLAQDTTVQWPTVSKEELKKKSSP